MPELPEVEVIARQFRRELLGAQTVGVKFFRADLRAPIPAKEFIKIAKGGSIVEVSRRGKYMLVQTPKGFLLLHFGMSGRLLRLETPTPEFAHTHMVWTLAQGAERVYLHYVDPRRFGVIGAHSGLDVMGHPCLSELGVEPLEGAGLGAYLYGESRNRKAVVKSFIMDANTVVGVGNIYACEALLLAKIHPLAHAGSLSRSDYSRLAKAIRGVLTNAINSGGTTFRDYQHLDGAVGYFKVALNAYGRDDCGVCHSPLSIIKISNRSTWICPRCQPSGA